MGYAGDLQAFLPFTMTSCYSGYYKPLFTNFGNLQPTSPIYYPFHKYMGYLKPLLTNLGYLQHL